MKTLRIVVCIGLLSMMSMIAGMAAWATTDTSVQLPPEASDNWWAAVQKNIRESEYHVTWQEKTALPDLQAAYQAPNRAHNLRTYFTETGIRVIPRTSSSPIDGGEKGRSAGVQNLDFAAKSPISPWTFTGRTDTPMVDSASLRRQQNQDFALLDSSSPAAVSLEDDQRDVPLWEWGLELTGYGCDGQITPVAPATLKTSGNRIEYHRGDLIEWYVNDQRGLEQGFTLKSPLEGKMNKSPLEGGRGVYSPPGRGQGWVSPPGRGQGWVSLELALTGTVVPKINADGTAIDFFIPPLRGGRGVFGGARVIRYSELHVFDASGKTLPAHFTLHENQSTLAIVVDASKAHYPITIDPLATSPNWMAEGNQANAYFSRSVGTAGDVNGDGYSDVIVGADGYDNGEENEGRVFIYYGSAIGLNITPSWIAESNQESAGFGYFVGTAGDVNGDGYSDIIVGAYGRVFVWYGSAGGLGNDGIPENADWSDESNQADAGFGVFVGTGTAGDVNGDSYSDIIVGAFLYDNGQQNEGRVFVYYGSAAGLSIAPVWMAESDQDNANFGYSAGTAGDVNGDGYSDIIVGAEQYNNNENMEGGVFVWYGSATGLGANGTPTNADWTAESNQINAHFGFSVGTAGDVNGDGYSDVIVGAYNYDNDEEDEGRAFVYHGSATGLSTEAVWIAEGDQFEARFGGSVGTAGDVNGDGYGDVIVGALWYSNGEEYEGQVSVYYGSAVGLSVTPNWITESNQSFTEFGACVGTAGDVNGDGYSDVIVGAMEYDNGENNEGAAFVYHGGPEGLSETEGWTVGGAQADGKYGYSVDTAGDVNGDGYADVVVGAPYYDSGQTDEGQVFVYHGDASGLNTSPAWTAEGDQEGAWFGVSAGTAGDVNGDGYADLVVGANSFDSDEENTGRTFVYFGSSGGLSAAADWTADGEQSEAGFGYSVGTAGDVNGDGFADIIIGSPTYDNEEVDEGAAFVYHGSPIGLGQQPAWMVESDQAGSGFGFSVGTAGDVNGDTYSDVIVGAYAYRRAFVYHGSPAGLSSSEDWWAKEDQGGCLFGFSVGTAGDLNGDGYSDIIVGAPTYSSGESFEGRAYVWYGSGSGLGLADDPADWTAESNVNSAQFGRSVSTAGDVNGDGYSDVIIGAIGYSDGETEEGRAYLWLGSELGLGDPLEPDWTVESNQASAEFGKAVASAGDVNGDGFSDVIVGAPKHSSGSGQAYVYYGNGKEDGSGGFSLHPRQRRSDNSGPISHLGRSDDPNAFRLALLGRTPYGRGKVKLEWEVKPFGVPFTGTGTQQSANWVDTDVTGVEFNQLVSGLSDDTSYHWRMRVRYHPVTTPFQQYGPWITMPWNGWQEADLFMDPPSITTVFPDLGSPKGGTTVTISGAGFGDTQGSGQVLFGATAVTTYSSWSDDEIVCETPAHAAGPVDVTVTTDAGRSAIAPEAYIYGRPQGRLGHPGRNRGPFSLSGAAVNMVNLNLYMREVPLWYDPPYGPAPAIALSYNAQADGSIVGPFGVKWQLNYGTSLEEESGTGDVTIVMPDGRRDTFIPLPGGAGVGYTPPYRVLNELTKIAENSFELRFPNDTLYVYQIPSGVSVTQPVLVEIRDSYGQSLTFGYTADGKLDTLTDALSQTFTFHYNGADLVDRVDDPFGRSAAFEYSNNQLTKITDMGGYWTSFSYDTESYLTGIEDARSQWGVYIEPSDGAAVSDPYPAPGDPMGDSYRITLTNPLGDKEEYYYNGVTGDTWYVSPRDYVEYVNPSTNNAGSPKVTQHLTCLDSSCEKGEIHRITNPEGDYRHYEYDEGTEPAGNRTSLIDARGHAWRVIYNDMARVTSMTDPKQQTTWVTYAANGVDAEEIRNGLGSVYMTYNLQHDVTATTDRLNNTVDLTYNTYGQLETQTEHLDGQDILTEYTYDADHNLSQIERDGNLIATLTYDAIDRVQTATDATGLTLTYTYNDSNQVTNIAYPDGKSVSYVYSNCCPALVDSITDRAGRITYFQYDDLKRLIESENPENGITTYGYDKNSNLTSFTDPETHTTSFAYDLDNRLVKKTYHDTTYVEWAYNNVGLVDTYTNARGTTMTYRYDANDNLTGVNYSDGTPNVSYDYDDFDRIEEMVDGIGTWGYGYDANSRLTSVDGPWNEDTITYDYDDLGRRTSMTPQRGTALTYVHDTLNRLTEIQRGTVATTYTYAYSGVNPLVQSLTRPNGSVTDYQYDLLNHLEEIANKTSTDAVINQFAFTYNNEDLRGSETITNGPAMPTLTEEDTTYDYNEVNQLLSTANPNQTFLYDDDGNLIQGYTPEGYLFSATYDAENHLTSFEYTDGGGIDQRTEYKYSGDGFLAEIWKYELTTLVERILIVRDGLLAIQDREPDNTVLREYTWGLNLGGGISGLINLEQNGQNYAYLYDGKGNVIAVLDNSEAVVATYRYDPFGILLAQTGSLTQPFGFSTKRYDPQTGLIYYGHRYYSPAIGRWTTRDPLGEAGGLNLYEFVGNNPVNWVDPWGLYRSHWILRALVPGQVAWDRAITAVENGDPLGAGLNVVAMLAEQVLVVLTWGESSALVKTGSSVVPRACDYTAEQWEAYQDELWWYDQMEQFEEQYPFPAPHTWQGSRGNPERIDWGGNIPTGCEPPCSKCLRAIMKNEPSAVSWCTACAICIKMRTPL